MFENKPFLRPLLLLGLLLPLPLLLLEIVLFIRVLEVGVLLLLSDSFLYAFQALSQSEGGFHSSPEGLRSFKSLLRTLNTALLPYPGLRRSVSSPLEHRTACDEGR